MCLSLIHVKEKPFKHSQIETNYEKRALASFDGSGGTWHNSAGIS
jgi:hypothetical protein